MPRPKSTPPTSEENAIFIPSGRHSYRYIQVQERSKENHLVCLDGLPEHSKHVTIYGPGGGIITWFNLTPEQCWLLADMLMENLPRPEVA